jgi:hypothetical protein
MSDSSDTQVNEKPLTLENEWVAYLQAYQAADKDGRVGEAITASASEDTAGGMFSIASGNARFHEAQHRKAEAEAAWYEAVMRSFGNIDLKWVNRDCVLENGEVYKWVLFADV